MQLVSQSVVSKFEEVANDSLRNSKNDLFRDLQAAGFRNEVASAVQKDIEQSQRKDVMLKILLNAFVSDGGTSGTISNQTSWAYRGISLELPDAPIDADFVVFNLDDRGVGFLICLTDPEGVIQSLDQLSLLANIAEENITEIERQLASAGQISIDADAIFTVLAIPKADFEEIITNIGSTAIQDAQDESWIWELAITGEQTISVFTDWRPDNASSMSISGDLDSVLSQPNRIRENQIQVNPDLFPSSHRYSKATQLARKLVSQRVRSDDASNTHFRQGDAVEYFTNQQNFANNAGAKIGESDAVEMIEWWKSANIITSISPSQTSMSGGSSYFRFICNSQNPSNIMEDVKEQTRTRIIDEEFERYVIRETLDEANLLN